MLRDVSTHEESAIKNHACIYHLTPHTNGINRQLFQTRQLYPLAQLHLIETQHSCHFPNPALCSKQYSYLLPQSTPPTDTISRTSLITHSSNKLTCSLGPNLPPNPRLHRLHPHNRPPIPPHDALQRPTLALPRPRAKISPQ
jgi:hypothetical protein